MRDMPGLEPADPARVAALLKALDSGARAAAITQRIQEAQPTLAEKIAALRELASTGATGKRDERRMERLLLSIVPAELSRFKFALEYDLDYKDLEEYVFHDIDDEECRRRIIEHLRQTSPTAGIKVLTDVDDTFYANFLDRRYPKGQIYPGVLEFYDALKEELFGPMPAIPVTTLSARPNPVAGHLEAASLAGLAERTRYCAKPLCPSALSGAIVSSAFGSMQDLLRAHLSRKRGPGFEALDPDDHALADRPEPGDDGGSTRANDIGRVKFGNFARYASVYPEYRYVFCGDSGQADALTARLMLGDTATGDARDEGLTAEGTSRVITTFIHDLRQTDGDTGVASAAFRRALATGLLVRRDSPTGRGIILHRDYVEAAIIAYVHRQTLHDLMTAEKLAHITRAALRDLTAAPPASSPLSEPGAVDDRLRVQYRAHGEEAFSLVTSAPSSPALTEAAREIRQLLDSGR